ncbi:MAG: cation:proton antiporter [Thiobacillus sp.]|uniref:cation:proton antiporter domain-containing protein n=1 Tax=Thiobacillus sp. TaxID=924 RepID=UPI002895F5DF|nr:cation:proton antiporter [Thiobacillus sp.]MDT3707275.1 cation:proton antiporter [Thiobacillus sp.]
MLHETPLISMIVAGLVLAFLFGAIANRFRLPPLVGYLLAGVVVGPYTPGFVGDPEVALELSELGVILLMFGVGLHFSLKDLLSVQALAVPGALLRIAGGTVMGLGLGLALGWTVGAGLLFGLALSVASTVVLLKALQDRHLVDSDRGRIAVGWVIVEDIAMVLALVLIPALAGIFGMNGAVPEDPFVSLAGRLFDTEFGIWGILAITLVKLAAFVGFMLVVGRRVIPLVLHFTAHTGSRELFRLAVLAIALGVAAGAAYLFGVSLALGAFFAGVILSESELSHRAAQETLPLRDAFAVLFFVAVGMLFDPMILVNDPLPVLGTLFIILVGKSVIAVATIVAFRRPLASALAIAAGLAQIGEFSFILASLGLGLGILPAEGRDLIVAGAIVSILVNPLLLWWAEALRPGLEARFRPAGAAPEPGRVEPEFAVRPAAAAEAAAPAAEAPRQLPTRLVGHTVLIGYGRVGTVIGEGLLAAGKPFLVVEDAEDRVAAARVAGIEVVEGNAATPRVLELANVEGARNVVIAIPNAFEAGQATEQCRKHNPQVVIVARAHSDEEEQHLLHLGANTVIMGEREIALGMLDWLTRDHKAAAALSAVDAVEAALAAGLPPVPAGSPAVAAPAAPTPAPQILAPAPLGGAQAPAVIPFRPRQPATTPAMPFNPEVPPPPAGPGPEPAPEGEPETP